jgi:hypothetical protein
MAKPAKWKHFGTKVNPKNNIYNLFYKKFRHQGSLDTIQILDEIDVPVAYEEPIEDYIADIREQSKGLIDATITHSSHVQQEDGYDASSEAETTIKGWRAELTEPEKKAAKEYFEINSLVKKAMTEYFGTNPLA